MKSLSTIARSGRPRHMHGGQAWKHLRPKSHWEIQARSWCRRNHWRPGPDVMTRLVETLIRADAGDVDAQDWLACEENRLQALVAERECAEKIHVRIKGDRMTRENLATGERVTSQRVDGQAWEHYETETYLPGGSNAETVPF